MIRSFLSTKRCFQIKYKSSSWKKGFFLKHTFIKAKKIWMEHNKKHALNQSVAEKSLYEISKISIRLKIFRSRKSFGGILKCQEFVVHNYYNQNVRDFFQCSSPRGNFQGCVVNCRKIPPHEKKNQIKTDQK